MYKKYCVRFSRHDGESTEEYFYNTLLSALEHLDLFRDDSTGLYNKIEIVSIESPERIVDRILFK